MYDLIIIGAGPAGITASVYAARKKINFLVISEDIGGQTAWSGDIENYTGYQFISGSDLASKFEEHLREYKITLKESESVLELKEEKGFFSVKTNKAVYQTRSLIIASGKRSRELNVPGEKEFKNKGVTYCATCDGPLFSKKDVAVIGGGNSGLDAAISLSKIANKIYLINKDAEFSGDQILQDRVQQAENITIINNSQVIEILGDKVVSGIKIDNKGKSEELLVKGVFIEIGLLPNSGFVGIVDKNEKNEIKIDSSTQTSIKGIFAAGDVTDVSEKQIIIAAGEGAKAALSAYNYLIRK